MGDRQLDTFLRDLTDAINQIPNFSIISTSDGPESTVTADAGVFGFDIGSSHTTFWAKVSGDTTTGWKALSLV
jgi:hypothetical protein